MTPAAAKSAACWLDPQRRPMQPACSDTWLTQPISTSSTSPGLSSGLRSSSDMRVWLSNSTACTPLRAPPGLPSLGALPLPIGDRTASTMTASRMLIPLLASRLASESERLTDNHFHDLAGTAVDPAHPRIGVGVAQRRGPPHTPRPEQLYAAVDHPALQFGAEQLHHRGVRR